MAIENTRKTVRDLLLKTDAGEIKWKVTFFSSNKIIFKYVDQITVKKSLIFVLTSTEVRHQSDLTILYGPTGDNLTPTLISILKVSNESMLYDLIESLNSKYKDWVN